MAKQRYVKTAKLVVFPAFYEKPSLARMEAICQALERDIKRHVDNVAGVHIDIVVEDLCSHCGLTWEVYNPGDLLHAQAYKDDNMKPGEPLCCSKAQAEFHEELAKAERANATG